MLLEYVTYQIRRHWVIILAYLIVFRYSEELANEPRYCFIMLIVVLLKLFREAQLLVMEEEAIDEK